MLAAEAYNKVAIYTKRYEEAVQNGHKEDSMAFLVLLTGAGVAKVSLNRDSEHNYQAVIDAIHQYYGNAHNQYVIDGYEDGIRKMIKYTGKVVAIQKIINIIGYELYKEKNKTNTFRLDCGQLLKELREKITEKMDNFKQEEPDFEEWLNEKSNYLEKNYGYRL